MNNKVNSNNVIFTKLEKGKRLSFDEIEWLRRGVKQYKKTHTYWVDHPCAFECVQCKHLEYKYYPDGTHCNEYKYMRFCPSCGAKIVTYSEYRNNE